MRSAPFYLLSSGCFRDLAFKNMFNSGHYFFWQSNFSPFYHQQNYQLVIDPCVCLAVDSAFGFGGNEKTHNEKEGQGGRGVFSNALSVSTLARADQQCQCVRRTVGWGRVCVLWAVKENFHCRAKKLPSSLFLSMEEWFCPYAKLI